MRIGNGRKHEKNKEGEFVEEEEGWRNKTEAKKGGKEITRRIKWKKERKDDGEGERIEG